MNSALTRFIQHHRGSTAEHRDSEGRYYIGDGAGRYGDRWKLFLSKQGTTLGIAPRVGVHKKGHVCRLHPTGLAALAHFCLLLLMLIPRWSPAADLPEPANPIVEGIECNGNTSLSCELIRRRSGIDVGRELDERVVESARLRLEALPNVRAVSVHLNKGSHKQRVIVVIEVVESSPLTTAFAIGTLAQVGSPAAQLETFAGRITDHDLFAAGKVLDLAVVGAWPIGGNHGEQYATRLEYLDPQLLGSRRYFFSAGAFYSKASYNFSDPPYVFLNNGGYQHWGAGFDVAFGVHLGTYTYATAGYRYLYLPQYAPADQYLTSDGVITTLSSSRGSALLFTLGRNTEDDPFFPTHGWLLHAYDALDPFNQHDFAGVVVRGTWRAGANAFWTFQARPFDDFRSLFDDDFGVSIVYSHALFPEPRSGAIRFGRWFVGPGITDLNHSLDTHNFEVGLKAGVRLETRYLGAVNLYVMASHLVGRGY